MPFENPCLQYHFSSGKKVKENATENYFDAIGYNNSLFTTELINYFNMKYLLYIRLR